MPTLSFGSTARLVRYAIPAIFVFWILVHHGVAKSQYDQVVRRLQSQQAVFIDDFLDNEIDGVFEGAGIDKLCESSQWIPGLVMSCDAAPGDVGEVRNAHLHCIRVAIAVGGNTSFLTFSFILSHFLSDFLGNDPQRESKSPT